MRLVERLPGLTVPGSGDLNLFANLAFELAMPIEDRRCRLAKVGVVRRLLMAPVDTRLARPGPPRRLGIGSGRSWSNAPKAKDIRLKVSDSSLSPSASWSSVALMGEGLSLSSPLRMRLIL